MTSRLLERYLHHPRALSSKAGPLFLSESHRNTAIPLALVTWSKLFRTWHNELASHNLRPPGVFSDLPAIFPGGCHSGWLAGRAGRVGGTSGARRRAPAGVPLTQDERPGSDLLGRWSLLRGCVMIRILHAFLVSDGGLAQCVGMLVACHIWTRSAQVWQRGEDSREYALLEKCHCSAPSVIRCTLRFRSKRPLRSAGI